MSDHSAIEWTDATWNPVTGCSRVSPGCANCYIERTPPFRIEGRRFVRVGVEDTTGVRLHPERLEQPLRWRKPRRVFVCSLADLFHEDVPDEYIARVFAAMALAPRHTFQVLTKRPERARAYLDERRKDAIHDTIDNGGLDFKLPAEVLRLLSSARNSWSPYFRWPLPNVWLGVSIENARHTWRADVLREIPAAVRFISAEPLLGSLFDHAHSPLCPRSVSVAGECRRISCKAPLDLTGIDWLIVGGESGPGARPMHPEWARELRDACLAQCWGCRNGFDMELYSFVGAIDHADDEPCTRSTAFFFKQVGGKTPKSGGRLLDGRTWDEMPVGRS